MLIPESGGAPASMPPVDLFRCLISSLLALVSFTLTCQRFVITLAPITHESGPGWFAIPFLYDSCIRYSMPIYTGAPSGLLTQHASSRPPVGPLPLSGARAFGSQLRR
jgi:hypothetical protein